MKNRTLHVLGCVLQAIAYAIAYLLIGRIISYFMMLFYLEPLHGWGSRDYWTGEIVAKPTFFNMPFDYYSWTMGYLIAVLATLTCIQAVNLLVHQLATRRMDRSMASA